MTHFIFQLDKTDKVLKTVIYKQQRVNRKGLCIQSLYLFMSCFHLIFVDPVFQKGFDRKKRSVSSVSQEEGKCIKLCANK